MKVNLTNTFDPVQIDAKTLKSIQPLVDFLNNHVSTVTTLLRGHLNIGDNIAGQVVQYTVTHGQWLSTNLTAPVSGVIPLSSQGQIVTGFGWQFDSNGKAQLQCLFAGGASVTCVCSFAVLS